MRADLARMGHLYRVSEAAMLLGVSPMTLYRRINVKEIKVVRSGERSTRIPEVELERLLKEAGFFESSTDSPADTEAGAA